MKNKIVIWISIILIVIILIVGCLRFINNQKDTNNEEITKPVDPIIDVIIKKNSSAKAENLEIQKEQVDGKYKVIDKKQSNKYHTVYYLVDPKTKEMTRFTKATMTIGQPKE